MLSNAQICTISQQFTTFNLYYFTSRKNYITIPIYVFISIHLRCARYIHITFRVSTNIYTSANLCSVTGYLTTT